ncbi:MAG: hypothetical protein OXI45_12955 [Acidobacteriota bacterium]|nr:hypothetical protein [Acidobacteriota bacterium]
MNDLERKKRFLQQTSELYREMIELTDHDAIKRYLAFRIIVNAMSFEDLIDHRRYPTMRTIRDTLLAHKQRSDFFEAFHAVDHIDRRSIGALLDFMSRQTHASDPRLRPLEIQDDAVNRRFRSVLTCVLKCYEQSALSGFRLTNNFLAHTGSHVHEISSSDMAGVFYRYNSSMALFQLSQCIFNNIHNCGDFAMSTRHAKLDMILHAQNMADCAIRDRRNRYSIDGLLEVSQTTGIGDPQRLVVLSSDASFRCLYNSIRSVRNGLIGHMDGAEDLSDLLDTLDQLPISDVHDLVNLVDEAVYDVSQTHRAILIRYNSANEPFNNPNIRAIEGFAPRPYDN